MAANLKIVLMGTPQFAIKPFEAIIKAGYNIVGLVSQPDRKIGRKQELVPTPTKQLAKAYGINVYQVEKIKDDYLFLVNLKTDLIITCAYGQFIPQAVLNIPKLGCINIHGSLLPKLRGGAPIHHALINGEEKTGISIMKMALKMDAGDVYSRHELEIKANDTYDSLALKLSGLAADAIVQVLPKIIDNTLKATPQNEFEVTFGYNIKPEEERLNWQNKAITIDRHIRGLSSIPGANSILNEMIVKVFNGEITSKKSTSEPGKIVGFDHGILVATLDYDYRILDLQLAGKKRMEAKEVINGFKTKLINQVLK